MSISHSSAESKCCFVDLAAKWCSSAVRAVPGICQSVTITLPRKKLPRDVDVNLAFLSVVAEVAIRLQSIHSDATDDTNAPPARVKDTPAKETESRNVLKNFCS